MDLENYDSGMEMTGSEATPEATPTPAEPETEEVKVDPTPETTTEETEETPKEKVAEELFDLPDGRKVNAAGLKKEYENLLPEFTRKSQALAEIERQKDLNSPPKDEPAWKNPDYVPENYAEVIEIAKAAAIAEIQGSAKAEQERVAGIQSAVEAELAEVKTLDPKLDENGLFQHANKYGFKSLKTAYENMSDMKKTAVDVEQRTVKNLKTRESDPISTVTGGELPVDTGYDPSAMSQFDGAGEYLASLKGKK